MNDIQTSPAFKFSILFFSGILIGSICLVNPLILLSITFALLIFTLFIQKKIYVKAYTGALCIIVILFGIFKSNIDFYYLPENSIKYISETEHKAFDKIKGIVKSLPEYDSSRIRFIFDCKDIIKNSDTTKVSGEVIVNVRKDFYNKNHQEQPVIKPGDFLSLKGRLAEPQDQRNPGEFDYRRYLELHNIYKTFTVTGYNNLELISKNNLNFFDQYILFPAKSFSLKNIDNHIEGDEAAFLKGLVTGERSSISDEMKNAFVDAGVMHLIAVSGLNVAYIIISVMLILSLLRFSIQAKTIITIILLVFYCMFTGNSPSIVRATIMGILVLIAFISERQINVYNIIGISSMIILIIDAKQLFDASFILSFTATMSMVVFLENFETIFMKKIRSLKKRGSNFTILISGIFFASLAAQLGTIPITASYFGKISVISLLANVVAVPLANLSLAVGFMQIIVSLISDNLTMLVAETNNVLLSFQIHFIKWCASLDFAYITVRKLNLSIAASFYTILFLILSIRNKREITYKLCLCFLLVCFVWILNYEFSKKLKLTFLDIGQGDCSLIETPDDKVILVDAGVAAANFTSGERTILPYLQRNGIEKVDLIIITHRHMDHIGGMNYLIENIPIGKIIESGQVTENKFTSKMDSLISVKKIPVEIVRNGDLIDEINNVRIYFLFPDNEFVSPDGTTLNDNLNNGSVTFILKHEEVEIFYSGDIESEAEDFLNKTYSDFLQADILKVAHHGSNTSSTVPFVKKNKPKYAVISCGRHNKFNHPSEIVLDRLNKAGANVFRTDLSGAIILESDGNSIECVEWK